MAEFTEDAIEAGRLLFQRPCRFMLGAAGIEHLPPDDFPEIAFAGRSNVGKSSLINALVGQKALARTSNTPGRTQEINFFDLDGILTVADMPGYGYAKAPKARVKAWTGMIESYLKGRASLGRTFVLIDARHGIKDTDRDIFALMDVAAQVYQVVLTKCDKVKPGPLAELTASIALELAKHGAAHPDIIAASARKDQGLAELRAAIWTLVTPAA